MKKNQMKFVKSGNEMKFIDYKVINLDKMKEPFNPFKPTLIDVDLQHFAKNNEVLILTNKEIACALDGGLPNKLKDVNFQIIDIREIKSNIKKVWKQWFPIGDKNTTMAIGVFWSAFMTYIFPWCLDLAKVYVAWKIVQGFYSEGKGVEGGKGGKGGFASLIHYGKWYIALSLIPWGVMLIDEVAHKMSVELMSHPLNIK